MTATVYRIENPEAGIGLWYAETGERVDFIRYLVDAKSRDLPMGFDPNLVGGWHSATDSLGAMADWLSASDVRQLAACGHGLYAVEVTGYRLTAEPYVHAVFRREDVVSSRLLPFDVLELTS